MKTKFYLLIAAIALSACSRGEAPAGNGLAADSRVNVEVNLYGSALTRAVTPDTEDESKVSNLQVFVFKNGLIDAYDSVRATSMILSVSVGESLVYALVNAPDLSHVSMLSELESCVSQLRDNSLDSFVMVGKTTKTFTSDSRLSIEVDRLVARVRINKITRRFASKGLADLDASSFRVVRFYLTHVRSDVKYDKSAVTPATWMNVSTLETGFPLIYNKLPVAAEIAQNTSYGTPQSLYCYPNPVLEDGVDGKMTRLVVECQINGRYYTYPIVISGGISSNKSYEISELVITRLGNPSDGDDENDEGEDDPIETVAASFEIVVNDWELCLIGNQSGVVEI